jgi:UDP-N-acetylmuramoyl-tripeptide--D-alanyl-D-alanine ligase
MLFIFFLLLQYEKTNIAISIFVGFYVFVYFLYKAHVTKEQSKKPLVITARIKRLYVTLLIIYLLITLPMIINFNEKYIHVYYAFVGFSIWFNYLFVYIANIINKPVEKLVFLHYKRIALNKLNSMVNLKKIAITGSYGKTSTKNFLNDILNVKYNSFATPKSFNTMYGLMNAINNYMDKFNDVFVAEMGAFKRGEIKEKAEFIKPQYGILTVVGTAHLESFGSRENIQKGKFELIDSLPDDGVAVLNKDDEYQTSYKIKSKCKTIWVSLKDKSADVYASNIKLSDEGTKFTCTFKKTKEKCVFETKLLGEANVYNILEAIALAYELGMNSDEIKIGVKRINTIEHRLELKKMDNITIIDDAYNSNPVGSKMALDVLNLMPGTKIVVTPGMIELGEKQYELNKEFGKQIADVCDKVYLIGKNQTKPIQDGLSEKNYNNDNIKIFNQFKVAYDDIIKTSGNHKTVILIENDLPDSFTEAK